MKRDPKQIELRKELTKVLKGLVPEKPSTPIVMFKNQLNVPVGTSFTHNSDSGSFTLTVFEKDTKVIGVDPIFNSVIFSKNLIETVRGKPLVIHINNEGEAVYFSKDEVVLSALPLEILEFVKKEMQNI